jgi:hypothetical protein
MPVLSTYVSDLTNLIQAPTSPIPLLPSAQLQRNINLARGQLAVSGDMVPGYGLLDVVAGTTQYPFTAISLYPEVPSGIGGIIAVETINWNTATGGQQPLNPITWQRYNRYVLGQSAPKPTPPRVWTQFGEGSSGTIWINPVDGPYTLSCRTRCYPEDLADDDTPDAIPYQWTDSVVFLAAWYCYMSLQRQADAEQMMQRFSQMMQVARGASIPDTLPGQFNGAPDPMGPNRLGVGTGPGRAAQPRQQTPPTAA